MSNTIQSIQHLLTHLTLTTQQSYETSSIIYLIVEIKKLKHKKGLGIFQGHIVRKEPRQPTPESTILKHL